MKSLKPKGLAHDHGRHSSAHLASGQRRRGQRGMGFQGRARGWVLRGREPRAHKAKHHAELPSTRPRTCLSCCAAFFSAAFIARSLASNVRCCFTCSARGKGQQHRTLAGEQEGCVIAGSGVSACDPLFAPVQSTLGPQTWALGTRARLVLTPRVIVGARIGVGGQR